MLGRGNTVQELKNAQQSNFLSRRCMEADYSELSRCSAASATELSVVIPHSPWFSQVGLKASETEWQRLCWTCGMFSWLVM